jgi:hypothetical protein
MNGSGMQQSKGKINKTVEVKEINLLIFQGDTLYKM